MKPLLAIASLGLASCDTVKEAATAPNLEFVVRVLSMLTGTDKGMAQTFGST